MVKNSPANAGDVGSIPGWETKIPYAMGQLRQLAEQSYLARALGPMGYNYREAHMLQLESSPHVLQLEKPLPSSEEPAQPNKFSKKRWGTNIYLASIFSNFTQRE